MIRIAAISMAGALALAGCASSTITPQTIATSSQTFVSEVATITETACAFVPTAETIAALATASSVSASAADQLANSIANSICGAVTKKAVQARRGDIVGGPVVIDANINGRIVKISGQFIK